MFETFLRNSAGIFDPLCSCIRTLSSCLWQKLELEMLEYCFNAFSLKVVIADFLDAHSSILNVHPFYPAIIVDARNSRPCTTAISNFNLRERGKSSFYHILDGSTKKTMLLKELKVEPLLLLNKIKSFKFQTMFLFSYSHLYIDHTDITLKCKLELF